MTASPSESPNPEIPQWETVFVVESNDETSQGDQVYEGKDVIFHVSKFKYLDFLSTILEKHDKSFLKVTENKRYTLTDTKL